MIIRAKTPAHLRLRAIRVSSAHVPKQRLLFEDRHIEGFFVVTPSRFGATFERLGEEKPAETYWEEVRSNDGDQVLRWLLAFHQWCREQKLDMVFFDRDEARLPNLPTFDW